MMVTLAFNELNKHIYHQILTKSKSISIKLMNIWSLLDIFSLLQRKNSSNFNNSTTKS